MAEKTRSRIQSASRRTREDIRFRLGLSLVITLAFVVVEGLAGWAANSLALLTDAAHNLTDVIALGLSWFGLQQQLRPSGEKKTFGYHRVGILVALVNSITLAVIALGIFLEAYRRLLSPPEVRAQALIIVGLMAAGVNLGTALLVRRKGETDLNLRAVFLHLMSDVGTTLAAVVAGIIIYFTGANWLDPAVSALIGIMILGGAWKILREAVDILLESTPRDLDLKGMVEDLLRIPGVRGVHDLHVWSLTTDLRAMSAHVLTEDLPISAGDRIQGEMRALLARGYNITHATLQLECVGCNPDALYCEIDEVADGGTQLTHEHRRQ